jgi:hypothetical protein
MKALPFTASITLPQILKQWKEIRREKDFVAISPFVSIFSGKTYAEKTGSDFDLTSLFIFQNMHGILIGDQNFRKLSTMPKESETQRGAKF